MFPKEFMFLEEIKFIMPPEFGGQHVESSFGFYGSDLYEMVEDRSDGDITFYKLRVPKSKTELPDDFWNGIPSWVTWKNSKKIYSYNIFSGKVLYMNKSKK